MIERVVKLIVKTPINIKMAKGELVKNNKKQNKQMLRNIPEKESDMHILQLPSFSLRGSFFC